MPCPLPHNHWCIIAACFLQYMLASPAHLYIPYLFTHCLPTIICVMLMSIEFFYFLFLLYVTFLCDYILACLCTYFCLIGFCVSPLFCLLFSFFLFIHSHPLLVDDCDFFFFSISLVLRLQLGLGLPLCLYILMVHYYHVTRDGQ